MGRESDSPCHSHTHPRQGGRFPRRRSSWELEFRDRGAIPGRGLLLTVERWIEGKWGRRLWWKMPVEESKAAMRARQCCWVMRRGWSRHHSLSPHRPASAAELQRLAQQAPEVQWLMCQTAEQDPSQGVPSMYLMPGWTEEDPRQGRPLSVWTGGATEKTLVKEAFWSPVQEA